MAIRPLIRQVVRNFIFGSIRYRMGNLSLRIISPMSLS